MPSYWGVSTVITYYKQGDKSRSERSIQRQELPITEYISGVMSKQELLEAQEQEQQLAYQDKLMERTKDSKNALESYVYDTRNKVVICNFFLFFSCNQNLLAYIYFSSFLRGTGALLLIQKGRKSQLIYNRLKIGFTKKVMMRQKRFTVANLRSWNR